MYIFLYLLIALLIFTFLGAVAHQIQLHRHKGLSREDFVSRFRIAGIPESIPAAVYDHFKGYSVSQAFRLAPEYSLDKVFGMTAQDDLDEMVDKLTKDLGISLPRETVLQKYTQPVETLGDLVHWLDWIRRQQLRG